ncbi:MAG: protein-disulfide reductase DsbD [Gammaproteobacteria bacterium]|nr:protein-disulfide reductase DsbD [Gammaproteobacteria bacterium]MBQ0773225.1 protein-disulfide reductase DsbD [Gammaproteobacteria bacterium]
MHSSGTPSIEPKTSRSPTSLSLLLATVLTVLLSSFTTIALALPGITPIEDDIPSAEQAIQVGALEMLEAQAIDVSFTLYPGVYLYRHRLGFRLTDTNGNLLSDFADMELPHGKPKFDEIFGDVEVFYDFADITLPLSAIPLVDAVLEVKYQGCLEDVLCYPPRTAKLPIQFVPSSTSTTPITPQLAATSTTTKNKQGFIDTLASDDANAFSRWMSGHGIGMVVILFFSGGLLLAFTPCVFPMIPILSGIIAGADNPSARRGFTLSVAYVLGVAVPYTIAGLLVAVFGAGLNLQFLLQQPAAIIFSALVFALLSLAMFGLYELQLPEFIRSRLNNVGQQQQGGSTWSAALMGAISGLVVSPCVTPILAGALIYVASSGDALTGALSLFSLAIGMGVPLIIMGTGGGHLLPKAGAWMDDIKRFFGVMMLAIAVWLLARIVPASMAMGLYGVLAAGYGIYLGALEPTPEGGSRMKRTIALMLALYGALLVVGAAAGGKDPLQPLVSSHHQSTSSTAIAPATDSSAVTTGSWQKLRGSDNLAAALAQAAAQGRPVLVDFYADWCASCKVLEEETLNHPDVLEALSGYTLIQADITEINNDSQKIMEKYNIFGLPCLVFFAPNGTEIDGTRILGEMGPEKFITHLANF